MRGPRVTDRSANLATNKKTGTRANSHIVEAAWFTDGCKRLFGSIETIIRRESECLERQGIESVRPHANPTSEKSHHQAVSCLVKYVIVFKGTYALTSMKRQMWPYFGFT